MTIAVPGSLNQLMNQVLEIEQPVIDAYQAGPRAERLRHYRWRPDQIELPAIYHWLDPSPFEQRDLARFRDNVNLLARVAVRHTDSAEMMDRLERYADTYRDVVDRALHSWQPIGGSATWAIRTGMRTVLDRFNDINVMCIEFSFRLELDRLIDPTH